MICADFLFRDLNLLFVLYCVVSRAQISTAGFWLVRIAHRAGLGCSCSPPPRQLMPAERSFSDAILQLFHEAPRSRPTSANLFRGGSSTQHHFAAPHMLSGGYFLHKLSTAPAIRPTIFTQTLRQCNP